MGGTVQSLKKMAAMEAAEAKKKEEKLKFDAVEDELQRRFRTVMGFKGGGGAGRRPMLLEGDGTGQKPTEGYLAVQAREREAALAKERKARMVAWKKYQEERSNAGGSSGMYSIWEREVYGNRI